MKLRRLTIKNFRGIREMEWSLTGDMICLIGPGDSTKSTILLALEYLFSGNWSLSVSDVDFYQMNVQAPIEIAAVVTELSDGLVSEDKFGLHLGFWNPHDGKLYEEQSDGSYQKALQIRLEIHQDLEPQWSIVSLQKDGREPQPISAADRRAFGVARIGNYTESDLAWGRNSALSRLTQKDDISSIPTMLAEAERNVLKALDTMDFSALSEAVQVVKQAAPTLGLDAQTEFRASMDPMRVNLRQGAIALFDGNLPLSLRGAGSRRLMTMAIHKASVKEGAVILVDEIENSLEPYRLRHLIRQLRPQKADTHQVIFTTHSPIALVECHANELYVVRSENGVTFVTSVGQELQDVVRKIPEAFLARKVIVCEGKTEAGFLIGLDTEFWHQEHQNNPSKFRYKTMAEAGAVPIEDPRGGGDESPLLAAAMARLGYRVAFFGDSDKVEKLNPSVGEMEKTGIKVVLWPPDNETGLATEERLCRDLPVDGLVELVELAIKLEKTEKNPDDVWQRIYCELESKGFKIEPTYDLKALIAQSTEVAVREALGEAAKHKNAAWFKRMDKGKALGNMLVRYLDEMWDTPTMLALNDLEQWCYG